MYDSSRGPALGSPILPRLLMHDQRIVSRAVVDAFLAGIEPSRDPLSPREREVLQLIAEGRTTKDVAGVLGLTPKTAETYRTNIMRKLDIHETASLVRYAIRHGFVKA